MLIERAFRTKAKRNDQRIGKADLEALEKEISIDVADLRRDIRNLRRDLGITTVNTALRRDDFVSRKVSASGRTKVCSRALHICSKALATQIRTFSTITRTPLGNVVATNAVLLLPDHSIHFKVECKSCNCTQEKNAQWLP